MIFDYGAAHLDAATFVQWPIWGEETHEIRTK